MEQVAAREARVCGLHSGGAIPHVHHSHHVTVDVVLTIIEFIGEANCTGSFHHGANADFGRSLEG